jgi:hypothetical protein
MKYCCISVISGIQLIPYSFWYTCTCFSVPIIVFDHNINFTYFLLTSFGIKNLEDKVKKFGACRSVVVEALCYKTEGLLFKTDQVTGFY